LGHGDEVCEFLPRKLMSPALDGVVVVDVVAGGKQTFLISDQGRVYSFGYGWYGALGHGNQLSLSRPQCVEALEGHHVVSVAAGGYHTLALTKGPSGLDLFDQGHD
jgi:alpha-tubulin suppressor-like RCC1 family protein